MNPIATSRLRLIPATADLVRLEIENPDAFFGHLEVESTCDWPSESLADALPHFLERLESDPSSVGWLAWYWVHKTPRSSQLIGGGGFKGAPEDGTVEIGYETRAGFRRQGFATEAMRALVSWALGHPEVECVVAEIRFDNSGSLAVLGKLGFSQVGLGSDVDLLRFERRITGAERIVK
ncbi:GNAT family N-acetyltransferase [Candidatus Bipolaricaulota bacterium]